MKSALAKVETRIVSTTPAVASGFTLAAAYEAGILGTKAPTVTKSGVETIVGCHSLVCNG
jgi:hypothetical protein